MNNSLTKIFNSNWFFLSALAFAIVLPLSEGLVSVMAGIMLIMALVEDRRKNKKQRLFTNKYLLLLPAIFVIYLISSVLTFKNGEPLYDLQKTLFYLVIPVAFALGKPFTSFQKRFLFFAFALAIIISTWVGLINWAFLPDSSVFRVHNISLISHIRFSFQLILTFWFLILLIQNNHKIAPNHQIIIFLLFASYFLFFLFFQQSLTGVVALGTSILFYLGYLVVRIKSKKRYFLAALLFASVALPIIYVTYAVYDFYDIEQVDKEKIEKTTSQGNPYSHNFNSLMVENGYYVGLYVCESELREEWNNLSDIEYDSIIETGYPVSVSLIRYLTSKGLRKDADGVLALSESDRQNIEHGMSNVVFARKKYSLYPRIYQTIWEYYVYSVSGNPNNQSFSQRIEFAKAAVFIIKNNFWFGVGTGHWKEEFKNAFIADNSKLSEELYASSHNQYLNYMVKFGFIGFVIIMFFLVYPVIKTRTYHNILFVLFLVFMFFANFADSNLESHMGSSFFLFFYSFFIVAGNDSWLKLNLKSD